MTRVGRIDRVRYNGRMIVLLLALPWIAATVWVGYRAGRSHLFSDGGAEFPTQASRLRAFGSS